MIKKLILLISIICIVTLAKAETHYFDKEGQYTKNYNRQDIINEAFNSCVCVKEGRKLYPWKLTNELNRMCFESFKEYLLKKSEKRNKIIIESYLTCEE